MEETPKKKFNFFAFIDRFYWLFFSLLIGILTFLCFYKLGDAIIYSSDEGRHGVNAYEMMKENNYIANYYNGELDYWNLKPPLSYYLIMLGYRIFGFNAWGLRFYSALSYLILVVIVALFLKKKFNNFASLISIVMFSGSYIFFVGHFVRHGDADSFFVLLVAICLISLYLSNENTNWLHLTGFSFALAFLTKSYHAFVLAPIILCFWLITKGFKKLKWWQYLTVLTVTLLPILTWLIARVSFDGWQFFNDMFMYDVVNRSANAIEGHQEQFFFFIPFTIVYDQVGLLCIALLVVTIMRKIFLKQKLSDLELIALLSTLSFYLIFGIAKTKLEWYIFPNCVALIMFGAVKTSSIIQTATAEQLMKKVYGALCVIVPAILIGVTFFHVLTVKTEDELQNLIKQELPVNVNADYYYEDEKYVCLERAELLIFEWCTNKYITLGGIDAFLENEENDSYLIVEISENVDISKIANEYLLTTSDNGNFAIYYRPAVK